MKNMFIVMSYTIKENIRKKTFLVTNIIILSLIVILSNIPNIINLFSKEDVNNNPTEEKIVVIDKHNIFKNNLNDLLISDINFRFVVDNNSSNEDLEKKLKDSNYKAILVIDEKDNIVTTDYTFRKEDRYYDVTALNNILKSVYTNMLLGESNVPNEIISKINMPFSYTVIGLNADEKDGTAYALSLIFAMFLYMSIYFYGYSVSSSISSEKTSRVMETLITSTKPSTIVLGKTLAMGLLGFLQIAMVFIVSYLSYMLFFPADYKLFGETLNLSMFSLPTILLIILYFVLGYAIYAMMSAVTGATVSKAEDLSAASMPISMISLFSFYLGYFSLMSDGSAMNVFASIMPLSSAFTMPSRIILGNATAFEVLLSISLLFVTIFILGWISIRVYSAALLHYGQRLTLKDLFKMYKND